MDEKRLRYSELLAIFRTKRRRGKLRPYEPEYDSRGRQVYCLCRHHDDGRLMISCDVCTEWFHCDCVGFSTDDAEQLEIYVCEACEKILVSMEASGPEPEPVSTDIIENNSMERKPRSVKSKESKSKEVKPNDVDKIRLMAKRNFFETISGIFAEAVKMLEKEGKTVEEAEISVNIMDPKGFVALLEEELFNIWAQETPEGYKISGEKYKSKYRSLQFNLKDPKNTRLRKRILSGDISINRLVTLSPEELANEQVRELAAQVRKESIQQTLKVKEENETTKKQEIELLYPQGYDPSQWQATVKAEKRPAAIDIEERDEKAFVSSKSISDATLMNDSTESFPDSQAKHFDKHGRKEDSKIKEFDLDSLLSQVQNGPIPPAPISGQKRHPDEDASGLLKKTKLDPSAGSSYDFAYLSDDGQEAEQIEDLKTEPILGPIIWEGTVEMPQVAKFVGACTQVAGIKLDLEDWPYIMPNILNIDGRIQPNRVIPYLEQQLHSSTKDLIVVEFQVKDAEETNYQTFFDYFYTKSRYAVIKPTLAPVKDMYLIPLKKNQPLPDFIRLVPHCRFPESRSYDALVCIFVMVRSALPAKIQPAMSDLNANSVQDLAAHLTVSNPEIAKLLSNLSSLGVPIV